MTESRRTIPPTARLVALVAAVKHGNFTDAAEVLGLTQAAVSRQILELERELGVRLFNRRSRGVVPTNEALRLVEKIAPALTQIARSVSAVKYHSPGSLPLTILADHSLAGSYVLPRVAEFEKQHPEITVRVLSTNAKLESIADVYDLAISYGVLAPELFESQLIAQDEVFPVAAPGLLVEIGCHLADLPNSPLLELKTPGRDWVTWEDFLLAHGHKSIIRPKAQFDSYSAAIEATLAAQGVLLAWGVTIRHYIERNLVQRVGHWSIPAPGDIRVNFRKDEVLGESAATFANWIAAASNWKESSEGVNEQSMQ